MQFCNYEHYRSYRRGIKRQTKEETILKVTQQIQNDNVKRLYERCFHVESIAEMLELEISFVKNAIQ